MKLEHNNFTSILWEPQVKVYGTKASGPFVVNTNGFDDFYASVDEAKGIMRHLFHDENMRLNYAHDLRKRTGRRSRKR